MDRWFGQVLRKPEMTRCGIVGSPDEVRDEIALLREAGADHLVLHPVSWSPDTVENLATIVAT